MSVRDDLQEKIEETRDDLAKLRKKLDEIEHLEQALRAANDGLAQAGYNVSELAGTTRIAQESLGTTLNALEEVTRVVQRLDPAAILSAIQATDTSIKSEVKDASNALTKTVSDHSQNLLESINANHETTQIRIREEGARLSEQQSKSDASIKTEVKDVPNVLTKTVSDHSQKLLESINASHETTQARIREEGARLSEQQSKSDASIKTEVKDVSNALTKTVSDHSQNLLESINASQETTQARIREEGARLSEQQSKVVKFFTWMGAFTLLGISALVVLAIIIFINI